MGRRRRGGGGHERWKGSRSGRAPGQVGAPAAPGQLLPSPRVTGPAALRPRPRASWDPARAWGAPAPQHHFRPRRPHAPRIPRTPAFPSSPPLPPGAPTPESRRLASGSPFPGHPAQLSPTRRPAPPPGAPGPFGAASGRMSGAAPLRAGAATPPPPSPREPGARRRCTPPPPGPARRPGILTGCFRRRPGRRAGEKGQRGGGAGGSAAASWLSARRRGRRRARRAGARVLASGGRPSDSGWRGRGPASALTSPHSPAPGPAPRNAPTPRRARAWLLLPRRAPHLSFYSLFPAPQPRPSGCARAHWRHTARGGVTNPRPPAPSPDPRRGLRPCPAPRCHWPGPAGPGADGQRGPGWPGPHLSGSRAANEPTIWSLCGRD